MPRYRVIGKHLIRATAVDVVMGTLANGQPHIVRQPGPMHRVEVGTILDDVTPEELGAFGDRFELVDEDALALAERRRLQALAAAGGPVEQAIQQRTLGDPTPEPPILPMGSRPPGQTEVFVENQPPLPGQRPFHAQSVQAEGSAPDDEAARQRAEAEAQQRREAQERERQQRQEDAAEQQRLAEIAEQHRQAAAAEQEQQQRVEAEQQQQREAEEARQRAEAEAAARRPGRR
jgi:hypothetical protein